ncbi:hypothetical protein B9P78_08325 [Aerococcus sp. 1KP-2016]|nr:hypothetical protein B9P78_08325 [Aerococcus sp. 1KP-2016]
MHERSVKNDRKNDLNKQERFKLINQIIRENQYAFYILFARTENTPNYMYFKQEKPLLHQLLFKNKFEMNKKSQNN